MDTYSQCVESSRSFYRRKQILLFLFLVEKNDLTSLGHKMVTLVKKNLNYLEVHVCNRF